MVEIEGSAWPLLDRVVPARPSSKVLFVIFSFLSCALSWGGSL